MAASDQNKKSGSNPKADLSKGRINMALLNPEAAARGPSLEDQVKELAEKIDRLKFLYEQYFLGRERAAPQHLRQDVEGLLKKILQVPNINTALKFKIQSLQARFGSQRSHWDRVLQQIEDGTYKRDRFRIKLMERDQEKGDAKAETKPGIAVTPGATPSDLKATAKPAAKSAAIETLMEQFVVAKKQCKEATGGLTYEKFAKTITDQTSALKKQYNCKTVRFKVVVENGKPKLKATPVS